MELKVDGQTRAPNSVMTYKSVLLQDVPNMAYIFGYTNAPWTLKADIASRYVCRLLNNMDQKGLAAVTPRAPEGLAEDDTIFGELASGYVRRSTNLLPRQGRTLPWRVLHHYEKDTEMLISAPIGDTALEFVPRSSNSKGAELRAAA
jgi:hypothetical protein